MRGDDAVSEAIGFIIIFSLMVTAIGIVTLYGYPALLDQQSATYEKTMEQNLLVLQHDLRALAREMVPYRETTMQVGGGVLSFVDAGRVVVEAGGEEPVNCSPGGLEYRSDDGSSVVSLSNGAVMTRTLSGEGSAMIGSPRWFFDDGTLVITVIELVEEEPVSFTGMGTIELSQAAPGSNTTEVSTSGTVNVTVTGPYRTAWKNYLTRELGFSAVGGDTWQKTGVDRLVIRSQQVSVGRG
ncbi:MAG: DUF7289 family protein [Methanomicrobiales archaeon]